ncbi:uncharacterized protein BX663DRAFT_444214 [Cokeromyces recurvatus]|uniref:uncharacterized protein n=1 Tax=Cokeromyces recurvatus TaxID=90255 RepID=UPI00221FD650|nr:uncharacterized protein BX663DRAFT_444214 [Cokeromyces recurvatus]KAI7897906.1 hypothetical protein BX663DRAFT_444214 [Cokeromyces recurvatus]
MSPLSRSEGKKDQAVGNMKDTVGSAFGNESLQSKGKTQNATGRGEEGGAQMSDYIKGTANQASGAVKGAFNSLTGDTSAEAANKCQQKKGEAQKGFSNY